MKKGIGLQDLAAKLERIREARADYIADTRALEVIHAEVGDKRMLVQMDEGKTFDIEPHALRQMEERVKIPAQYADRLLDIHPDLLAHNLNELFQKTPEKRMLRTLDNNVRAFLSDSYRIMDNYDLAEAVLPTLIEHGAEVISCDVTHRRMYIKAIRPDLTADFGPPPGAQMGVGHTFFVEHVQAGITISNSEIGAGRLTVQPSVFTERCTNWCSFDNSSYARVHLGAHARGDSESMIWQVMSDTTRRKSDDALWSQVRDVAVAAMDGTIFEKIVDQLRQARGDLIEGDPVVAVQRVGDQLQLTDSEVGGVLNHLIKGGDLSRYGMHTALTSYAADADSYDRATELEQLGARVIDLPARDWQRLAA